MKNKVYVERFGHLLMAEDKSAAYDLFQCFINEYNAEITRRHIRTDEDAERLVNEFNRKGNELAEMLAAKAGRKILHLDWFSNLVKLFREQARVRG